MKDKDVINLSKFPDVAKAQMLDYYHYLQKKYEIPDSWKTRIARNRIARESKRVNKLYKAGKLKSGTVKDLLKDLESD